MEEATSLGLAEYLSVLRRRRWQLIIPAMVLFLLFALAAIVIPSTYRSQATILIEQQEIPQDLVRSTVTSFADKRVQTISQRVMTTANLGKIIEKYDLYLEEREQFTVATVVETMREDIELKMISADVVDPRSGRPTSATIAFSLSYDNESPEKAQKVANELTSLFLNENIKERRQVAQEASRFLTEESDKLAAQIAEMEAKLAVFKEENSNNLPELQALNREFLRRTEDQLIRNEQDVRSLDERIIFLQGQMAQTDPYSNMYSATGQRVLSAADRLKALEAEYTSVASRYSADHPSRIAMERELVALRQEVGGVDIADLQRKLTELKGELAALSKRYSTEHPDVKGKQRAIDGVLKQIADAKSSRRKAAAPTDQADNPAYIQLQSSLQAAQAERRSLLEARKALEEQLKQLEQRLVDGPRVEQEYLAMMREYDNAVFKFKEMKNKQVEAQLAESLETESKSERFVLVEPPLLPEEPDSPNRIAILLVGFIVSLGGGAANVGLREAVDDGIHGAKALAAVAGMPPLAVIPYIETQADRSKRRWRNILVFLGLVGLIVIVLALIHFLYRPLDVLYFQVLRQFVLL
ncbi:MAG: lipopolysaccharide biosynthesis protein [Gammaproteobacteria bacterium]|nr:lipopolysaccharide biosynthesis protein [Gammaproteobacteria bacterium]